MPNQVALHQRLLVVLAELDRRAGEQLLQQLDHSSPAIDSETAEAPALCMQAAQAMRDVLHLLMIDLLPVDITAQRPVYQQTVVASEERGIEGKRYRSSRYLPWPGSSDITLELAPERLPVAAIALAQLGKGLPAMGIVAIRLCYPATIS